MIAFICTTKTFIRKNWDTKFHQFCGFLGEKNP
jgi:hypothetical protein